MRKRFVAVLIAAVTSLACFGTASAVAATEFGDPCIATSGTSTTEYTLFGVSAISSPLPLAAPSAGVITGWKLNLITPPEEPIPAIIPQTLKAVRVNGATHTAQVVGEASGMVGSGANTIPARIPIQAGDRLALYGHGPVVYKGTTNEVGTLLCEGSGPGDTIGAIKGNVALGASGTYEEVSPIRVPAVAVVEPDADNDGFGDETQDACPQSAAVQVACPVVKLSISASAKKKLVTVLVTGTTAAKVTVNGRVSLGKGKKAKLKGGTKEVTPGTFTKFKLKFTAKLIARLKELTPSKKLTLKITSTAPNLASAPTKKVIKVKLKGQGQA
jgi:hypothetical protein